MANKTRYYYIEGRKIGLIENTSKTVDGVTSEWSSISEVKTMRIKAVSKEADFTTDLTTSGVAWDEIPSEYHETIVDAVIAELYARPEKLDPNAYPLFRGRYLEGLKEAKKYSRMGHIRTGIISPQDF